MPLSSNTPSNLKPVFIDKLRKSAIRDLFIIAGVFFTALSLVVVFHLEPSEQLLANVKYNNLLEINEILLLIIFSGFCAFIYIWRRFQDIKLINKEFVHKAYFDDMTQLPNRALAFERLKKQMLHTRRGGHFAVAFIDFDRFKVINDTYGHHVGDELLRQVGKRLASVVLDGEMIARLGGDEFLFVSPLDESCDIEAVMARIKSTRKETFTVSHTELNVDYSIGVAIYPDDGETISELLKSADTAMYHAKLQGDEYCIYTKPETKSLSFH